MKIKLGMVKFFGKQEDLKEKWRKKVLTYLLCDSINLQGEVGIKDITNTFTNIRKQTVSAVCNIAKSKLSHLVNIKHVVFSFQ